MWVASERDVAQVRGQCGQAWVLRGGGERQPRQVLPCRIGRWQCLQSRMVERYRVAYYTGMVIDL